MRGGPWGSKQANASPTGPSSVKVATTDPRTPPGERTVRSTGGCAARWGSLGGCCRDDGSMTPFTVPCSALLLAPQPIIRAVDPNLVATCSTYSLPVERLVVEDPSTGTRQPGRVRAPARAHTYARTGGMLGSNEVDRFMFTGILYEFDSVSTWVLRPSLSGTDNFGHILTSGPELLWVSICANNEMGAVRYVPR